MKNKILRTLDAVGMHHWSGRELEIGPLYYCRPEDNSDNDNAIAVYQDKRTSRKAGYLRREDTKVIKQLFVRNFAPSLCYLRAKFAPEKVNKRKRPMQNVGKGFRFKKLKNSKSFSMTIN